MTTHAEKIGYTCAYAPLALIDAAGYTPYRILPMGNWPDQAGQLLHDNLCPHVKRILDRAMDDDLPEMEKVIFVNSCDAMRRVADAWQKVRPGEGVIRIDLPVTRDDVAVAYLADELRKTWRLLKPDHHETALSETNTLLKSGIERYNRIAGVFMTLRKSVAAGRLNMTAGQLQALYNNASTRSFDDTLEELGQLTPSSGPSVPAADAVPLFLFGNVLPDPEALALFETCGAKIADDDFCTGSRLFNQIPLNDSPDLFETLARGLLRRPLCARTFDAAKPHRLAEEMLLRAEACGAKGVIAYTMKFCDPYLARLPIIRERFKQADVPFLFLEGDCTLRSIGQQRTRIEAFIEMLR